MPATARERQVASESSDPLVGPRIAVIGGGLAGMAAARRLARQCPGEAVTLIEATARLGGKVLTETVDGFVVEAGPEAMVTSRPRAIELCRELDLDDRLVTPFDGPGSRILYNGQLQPLPVGMGGMVPTSIGPVARSRLFSPRGKLRMAMEPLVPPRRDNSDETVQSFVERRLGRQAYARLVEPLVGGIYAGDPGQLSVAATLPHLRELERRHGGLVRGMTARRRAGLARPPAGSPFVSLAGGLRELVDALARDLERVGVRVRAGAGVAALAPDGAGGIQLGLVSGEWLVADAVVVAVPPPIVAGAVAGLDANLAEMLRAMPHATAVTVAVGYPAGGDRVIPPLTGYLVPLAAGRRVRACTVVTNKWAGRAPVGAMLFRLSLGGAGRESVADRDDAELVAIARAELGEVLGVVAEPVLSRVYRWRDAMPQYVIGHAERVAAIERRVDARWPRLAFAGGAWHGAGMADAIASGERAAERILAAVPR